MAAAERRRRALHAGVSAVLPVYRAGYMACNMDMDQWMWWCLDCYFIHVQLLRHGNCAASPAGRTGGPV